MRTAVEYYVENTTSLKESSVWAGNTSEGIVREVKAASEPEALCVLICAKTAFHK